MKEHRISTNNSSDELPRGCRELREFRNKLRHFLNNKRGYSTEGSTLLPSVLRPRLFGSKKNNFSKTRKLGITTFGIISAISFVSFGLINNDTSATVQATLTIPDSISVNVNPYENNGFAEGSVGKVEVSTNNQAGYTLSIKSKDGTELKNGSNSLQSISTNLTTEQYQNGDYFNTWGFKPDVVNNLANSSYIPGPNTSGIELANTHTNSLAPETFNLAIATKVDKSIAAGNYTNSFVLTATGNEARYNIKFDVGKGSGGPEGPKTDYIGDDLEVQIPTDTPTSTEGKDFLGWCSKQPREDGSCTGVIVQPGGCFPLCKCDLNLTLYAMYGTKSGSTGGGGGADFYGITNGTDCEYRGHQGKVYGGMCWMWSDLKTGRNWQQANADCAAVGWSLPSYADFATLVDGTIGIGDGAQLYDAGWKGGSYWSSTSNVRYNTFFRLIVDGSNVSTSVEDMNSKYSVRCVAG